MGCIKRLIAKKELEHPGPNGQRVEFIILLLVDSSGSILLPDQLQYNVIRQLYIQLLLREHVKKTCILSWTVR